MGLKYSDGSPGEGVGLRAHRQARAEPRVRAARAFFLGIEGADDYVKNGKAEADISGIEADDATGRHHASGSPRPDGTFSNVLAMNFAGLVPGDTPFKNLTKRPAPGRGPYVITESVPNRDFVLKRNRRFRPRSPAPAGQAGHDHDSDRDKPARQAQDVIAGDLDYMQDPPPADMKPRSGPSTRTATTRSRTASTYYFFMNTRVAAVRRPEGAPGRELGVRQARLARLFAGEIAPGCSFLPPGCPGTTAARRRGLPVGRPEQAARPREGAPADRGGGRTRATRSRYGATPTTPRAKSPRPTRTC